MPEGILRFPVRNAIGNSCCVAYQMFKQGMSPVSSTVPGRVSDVLRMRLRSFGRIHKVMVAIRRLDVSELFAGDVLLVEDNIIIAMDAEELVLGLGAPRVHVASSVDQARRILDAESVVAAILDYNLEGETSESVADTLVERGTPFVFATGYSGLEELPARFQGRTLLQKPYTADDIGTAFAPPAASAA